MPGAGAPWLLWSGLATAPTRGVGMIRIIVFKGGPDPWHPTDGTGFSKIGYVTNGGVVIHPRRSRIAQMSLAKLQNRPHRIMEIANHQHESQIATFFTKNVIGNTLYVRAITEMANPNSTFWRNPIKVPILSPITHVEHEARWSVLMNMLRKGDSIYTLDTHSVLSRVIKYLDQGTWSHVGIYTGNGLMTEAIASGVVERSIEAYHHPRYRLGIYRLPVSPEQIERAIRASRSQVGKPYAFGKVFKLGVRLILGIWPKRGERRHTTPNMGIALTDAELVALV